MTQSLLHRFIKDLPLGLHLVYKPNQSSVHSSLWFLENWKSVNFLTSCLDIWEMKTASNRSQSWIYSWVTTPEIMRQEDAWTRDQTMRTQRNRHWAYLSWILSLEWRLLGANVYYEEDTPRWDFSGKNWKTGCFTIKNIRFLKAQESWLFLFLIRLLEVKKISRIQVAVTQERKRSKLRSAGFKLQRLVCLIHLLVSTRIFTAGSPPTTV